MAGLTLPVGTELGGYVLQGVLGQGASGTVYQAEDADGLQVAFKLLHSTVAGDPAARQRLRREVELLQRVKASCVARVLDAETQQAEAFVVTELVDGTSLEQHLKQHGPFEVAELASLAANLTEAIATIHQAEVIHRDLKPANLMMRRDGSVVLIDFGLAQEDAWSRLTGTGLIAGTPGFVAPELLRGGDVGPGADCWAAAALLLSAATGRPPFGSGGVETVLARVLENDPDTDGLDATLAALLRQATMPDLDQRLDLESLVDLLAALARGEAILPPVLDRPKNEGKNLGNSQTKLLPSGPVWADQPISDDLTEALPGALPGTPGTLSGTPATPGTPGTLPGATGTWLSGTTQMGQPEAIPPPKTFGALGTQWPGQAPETKPTPLTSLAFWLLAGAVALHWPVVAAGLVVIALWFTRTVWVANQAVAARQRKRGERPSDAARTAVGVPWYLVRAAGGLAPGLILAAAVVALVHLMVGKWTTWQMWLVDGCLVACGILLLWWGPAADGTRQGGRRAVRSLAPKTGQRLLLDLGALLTAGLLIWLAV